ncbi:MAG: nicotinamide riboside transporter PnuC [Gammaproteobacteria bacterium]
MSQLELLAVALAIVYLLLAIRENRWCWPAAALSSLAYLQVFYGAGLYMQAALQLFYAAMGIYGWWAWRPAAGGRDVLRIHRWPFRWHVVALTLIGALGLVTGTLLTRYTAAEVPYVDSLVSLYAVLATWMVTRKLLENWLYWIVIDSVTLGLALNQGLRLTAGLFALYVILAVVGGYRWLKNWRQSPAAHDVVKAL